MSYGFRILNSTNNVLYEVGKPGAWTVYANGVSSLPAGVSTLLVPVAGLANTPNFQVVDQVDQPPGELLGGVYKTPDGYVVHARANYIKEPNQLRIQKVYTNLAATYRWVVLWRAG